MEGQSGSVLTGGDALICEPDPALREKIGAGLKNSGYAVTFSETDAEAIGVLRLRVFDVVVVNESLNETLRLLAGQNMSTRRRFFVALTGKDFTTRDNMMAFNNSVNIVINTADVDDFGEIVRQGVVENNDFYRVFNDTLRKVGKV